MNEIAEKCSLLCDKMNRGEELSDEEKQFVKGVTEIYSDEFSNTDWAEIGKNILKGFGDGLKKTWDGVAEASKNILTGIGDGIKRISQMPEEERENEIKKLLNQEDK